ncbi:MAG: hypothetical protein ACK4WH_03210 [Phycisphaerales bacterium]
MSATRSLWQVAADLLALRKPTRLTIDGLLLIIASVAVAEFYDAYRLAESARGPVASVADKVLKLSSALGALSSTLYYGGWVLVAVGCARIVADGRPSASEAAPTQTDRD